MYNKNAWLVEYPKSHYPLLHEGITGAREREMTERCRPHRHEAEYKLRCFIEKYSAVFSQAKGMLNVDSRGAVCVDTTARAHCTPDEQKAFERDCMSVLQALIPWRKGPFTIASIDIDAEWNSAVKWNRITRVCNVAELCNNKRVLDIGCNNFYYALRFAHENAHFVVGMDPMAQYGCYRDFFTAFVPNVPVYYEALGAPLAPYFETMFDTIFCMGIVYHQRNPLECIQSMRRALVVGGTLVVESVCITSDEDICLFPQKTYQRAPGFWFIPSVSVVCNWLTRCGFEVVAYDKPARTTPDEQRKTQWIESHSLEFFLDSGDASKTVEGYEAPHRCVVVARKKS